MMYHTVNGVNREAIFGAKLYQFVYAFIKNGHVNIHIAQDRQLTAFPYKHFRSLALRIPFLNWVDYGLDIPVSRLWMQMTRHLIIFLQTDFKLITI